MAVFIVGVSSVEIDQSFGPRPYRPIRESYVPVYVEDRVLVEEEEEEEKFLPQPYKYEYGVQDEFTQAAFTKSEAQNEAGAVTGSYKVNTEIVDHRVLHSMFR